MNYGRYQVINKLGEGTSGVMYQAYDPQIDRMIALKVLREERVTSEDFVNRFIKEAKAAGRLSHPNIVTVYDVGQDHDTIYIAMEFLDGNPLDRVIREGLPSLQEVVEIGIQLAEALDYAHQQGIIHRDIKPPNIILLKNGQAKITDFGIARVEEGDALHKTQDGVILGTPKYMSPEQVTGSQIDGRSDIYSLGAILYELVAGQPAFQEKTLVTLFGAITQKMPTPPDRSDSDLPVKNRQKLSAIILKCLAKTPEARYDSGNELHQALRHCLNVEYTPDLKQSSARTGQLMLWFTGAVLSCCLALGVFYFWPDKTQTLNIGSNPAGARIFIDGDYAGQTPLQLNLVLGKHEVRMSLADYYEWEAQIQLEPEQASDISIPLIPISTDDPLSNGAIK